MTATGALLSTSEKTSPVIILGSLPKPRQPIIVVDDSADDRLLLTRTIHSLIDPRKLVLSFSSGNEFLDYMNDLKVQNDQSPDYEIEVPEMVFLDLLMPDVDGLATLENLRRQPIWMDIPVTLVTGSRNDIAIQKAAMKGANAFLSKPFTKAEVLMAISKKNNFSTLL